MDLSIARGRIASVIKPDSITASQGDFLATHVPLKRINLLNRFELQPSHAKLYTEEELYDQCILNSENRHQFITVYGQSGTGKSHLIRWFEARFSNDKPENEVVLFIRRSDNTLKGTIRQLLDKPEVQGIANKAIYDRLVRAAVSVESGKLKDLIYHNYIIEIAHDNSETHAVQLNNVTKKRLEAFLGNDVVHSHLMEASGPIERMYAKVAENTLVDRDTIAEFTPEDFLVTPDLYDAITAGGADSKAERMARKLMADEDGKEEASEISSYLNQFVNDVIQRCAGIEPGDFRQIFQDIRCELRRLGKNLTLFIEDVTSFTGVDDALLDALIVEHTGMNAAAEMCRISSIVGTTSNYLQNNFRDNHKDRITNLIYIPSDVFDEAGIYEFVGRYLNTMSLSETRINDWLANRALSSEYPVHTVKEGKEWDSVTCSPQVKINLYPFSKAAIMYLYKNNLTQGHQTPRYIIRDIIEPVMNDILNNAANFPSDFCPLIGISTILSYQIHNQVSDTAVADRMLRFLTIWGNGKPNRESNGTATYFAGIKESIITELGFPVFSGATAPKAPQPMVTPIEPITPNPALPLADSAVPQEAQNKLAQASSMLTEWINGKGIDVSATGGTIGILNKALGDLNSYLRDAINWLAEGVSPDDVAKALSGSRKILVLERQSKGTGYYTLSSTWESMNLLEVMIRWREFGKQSWAYPDADFDLYLLSSWTFKIKDDIVHAIEEDRTKHTSYIEAAIVGELYQLILLGEYGEKSLKNLTSDCLFGFKGKSVKNSSHSPEWIRLCDLLTQRGADDQIRETVLSYFNLPQGERGSKLVLDEPHLARVFRRIKLNKLVVPAEDLVSTDPSIQRQAPYRFLKDIFDRLDNIVKAEVGKANPLMKQISAAFQLKEDELLEQDMLTELVDDVNRFYTEINNNQINIPILLADPVKKAAKQIVKAYKDVQNVLDSDDSLSILMAFSGDPITLLQILTTFLSNLNEGVEKAKMLIAVRLSRFGDSSSDEDSSPYAKSLNEIDQAKALWEGGNNDVH
ncbi:MAG: ATP-binding protein [Raoultibacter sp.]